MCTNNRCVQLIHLVLCQKLWHLSFRDMTPFFQPVVMFGD